MARTGSKGNLLTTCFPLVNKNVKFRKNKLEKLTFTSRDCKINVSSRV